MEKVVPCTPCQRKRERLNLDYTKSTLLGRRYFCSVQSCDDSRATLYTRPQRRDRFSLTIALIDNRRSEVISWIKYLSSEYELSSWFFFFVFEVLSFCVVKCACAPRDKAFVSRLPAGCGVAPWQWPALWICCTCSSSACWTRNWATSPSPASPETRSPSTSAPHFWVSVHKLS